jgi:glycosyltransferase involved in cell wall biosynthesis
MSRPGRFVLRTMFRSSDRVVVLGELWRRWVIESFGVSPGVVSVVRNGVPATTMPRVPRPAGGPFRLLFLGNLQERKGISDLLHALASPVARSADWHLTAAGGGAIDTYERLAASLGIAEKVHFTGWVDQAHVRTLLAAADAMVLPSYDEGLPLVILEAMATGVPVICTPVGAIPEVFKHRHTALFVRPGDRDGLAAAIVDLGRDAALQASLSREGLGLYQREFTMGVFAARIGALYTLLDPPQRKGRLADLGHATEAGGD